MNDSANTEGAADYRVLARKYRPQTFDDLIGQDALVRTLRNALDQGRLAHAFVLTGVRGVGKTTTARIIAKGLNCIGSDGTGGPTVNPCGVCDNCRAITEDRHIDVMEMDAASRTGVDDIREIIDGVRYKPVSARYKVYIIDEVHMLSRNAFNALLKTLEEPPEHVKFVFATTEIRKVPITVLSRCQRFDLRRIGGDDLIGLFSSICDKEGADAAPEALRLIARAADGSARDGLSLLDQAIALASGPITPDLVQEMLGLADRAKILDLFEDLMRGKLVDVLRQVHAMHDLGADPLVIAQDLLETTHLVTRFKVAPDTAGRDASDAERARAGGLAEGLGTPHLGRAWQMLLKGISEIQQAPSPLAALEMVLIRLAHLIDLPGPADTVRPARDGAPAAAGQAPAPAPAPATAPATGMILEPGPVVPASDGPEAPPETALTTAPAAPPVPATFDEIVALFDAKREAVLHARLAQNVRPVRVEPGVLEIAASDDVDSALTGAVAKLLVAWTGVPWAVSITHETGTAAIAEQEVAKDVAIKQEALADPVVAAVLGHFPGAAIEAVRPLITTDDDAGEPLLEAPADDDDDDDDEEEEEEEEARANEA